MSGELIRPVNQKCIILAVRLAGKGEVSWRIGDKVNALGEVFFSVVEQKDSAGLGSEEREREILCPNFSSTMPRLVPQPSLECGLLPESGRPGLYRLLQIMLQYSTTGIDERESK